MIVLLLVLEKLSGPDLGRDESFDLLYDLEQFYS